MASSFLQAFAEDAPQPSLHLHLGAISADVDRDLYCCLLKEPVCIAAEHLGDLFLHLPSGYANSINDPAEIGLVDAHELSQAILTHACCVHPELQIGID